ncbi:GFA family protein [Devosia sp.]|uniref:GFA family protein n=1 Tax=Devosia sp. TaxID=1871048 RepID=UPI0027327FDB|nr:GFA family protein [Devosia sp.]MDP2779113.1 GFA family protein [Devosia sp.]
MTISYAGGCACGAIRFETGQRPIFQNHCQCLDCQKRSGTDHSSYLTFPRRSDMRITGQASEWRVTADSGHDKLHAFCPNCGTPVYLTFTAMPDLIAVHASALDDPGQFNPQALTYSMRGPAWGVIDPSVQRFERMAG